MTFANLTDWQKYIAQNKPPIWQPSVLTIEEWPPDYEAVWNWRIETLKRLQDNPAMQREAKKYYSTRFKEFIMHWMDTYNPRKSPTHDDPLLRGEKWLPFVFFSRQADLIDFFQSLEKDQQGGLLEKCRDMGATWLACGYTVCCWLFLDDDSTGWGSRKEDLVDTIGDPDSIFEKCRLILRRLPPFFLPDGFNWKKHSSFMKLMNPENGSTITGEAGDNIGRGGRKSRYFKDESAHYERPEKIESALGDNTNVQIDISSVNGLGNVFHKRREAGKIWYPGATIERGVTRVFIMDWKDHPEKTQQWYEERKERYEREGLAHIFAQEVDRNYSAAVSNTLIPWEHTQSAIDAHLKIPYLRPYLAALPDIWCAGLDVADQGPDRNALSLRQWIIWRHCEEWGERDPGVTARRAIVATREHSGRIKIMYDSLGVGAGVKTEYNRLTQDEKLIDAYMLPFVPWAASASVLEPFERIIKDDERAMTNKDYYANLKSQAWGTLAQRFYKTHMAVTKGVIYPAEELISLDSSMPLLDQLCKELAQAVRLPGSSLRMVVDKSPGATRSPNLADSGVQMYFPIPDDHGQILVGTYG